jgi:AbiJ N-terminal domain 4
MTDPTKRFSLRHGIEAEPSQPIFEDAPKRLRYFVLEYLRNTIHDHEAVALVARALCLPELIGSGAGRTVWETLQPYIFKCEWWEVYNILEATYVDLAEKSDGWEEDFAEKLNRVFSEESIGWKMDPRGRLQRLLPEAIQVEAERVFGELQIPRFAPALAHMQAAHDAYNFRPRRDLEVCSSAFDALESVAKEVFSMPTATFGAVIKEAGKKDIFAPETLSVLEKLYGLANNHFRHGMTEPFRLGAAEVEFVYVSCMAGILLFIRHAGKSKP